MSTTMTASNALPQRQLGRGFGWRIAVSILSVFGWASLVLLYFAFWANKFEGLQSAVLILVSLLVFVAVNGATWAGWGARYGSTLSS